MKTSNRKVTKVWTTRLGERIRICDMSDSHLENTLKFLRKRHAALASAAWGFAGTCRGEMASYYAEQDAMSITTADITEVFPIYEYLERESERRKLLH